VVLEKWARYDPMYLSLALVTVHNNNKKVKTFRGIKQFWIANMGKQKWLICGFYIVLDEMVVPQFDAMMV
jgi:hypothetical protein